MPTLIGECCDGYTRVNQTYRPSFYSPYLLAVAAGNSRSSSRSPMPEDAAAFSRGDLRGHMRTRVTALFAAVVAEVEYLTRQLWGAPTKPNTGCLACSSPSPSLLSLSYPCRRVRSATHTELPQFLYSSVVRRVRWRRPFGKVTLRQSQGEYPSLSCLVRRPHMVPRSGK